jgi:sugar phosphate isomerase/epimerase
MVSGMFRTAGEDYSTLDAIRLTGGVVPDNTWDANWQNIQATALNAQALGLKLVTFHAGFLPHQPDDPTFDTLQDRIRRIARLFAKYGIQLGLETGQEDAATLVSFLKQLAEPNVGVNFDPANMLLYDKGDPISALRALGPWLRQCHIKDAIRTTLPGAWGQEVPVGQGQVDWPAFFETLADLRFGGFCCIEREACDQRLEDIVAARKFVEKTVSQLL